MSAQRAGKPLRDRLPMLFGLRRWVLERENARLRMALREVMHLVTTELDPDPHPWAAYAASKAAQETLNIEHRAWLIETADEWEVGHVG